MRAALDPIPTGFADPTDPQAVGSRIEWGSVPDVVEGVRRIAEVSEDGGRTRLVLTIHRPSRIPYFDWAIGPLVRGSLRRGMTHMADVISARASGSVPPVAPKRPVWAPPDRATREQTVAVATVCAVLAIITYGGSLFTQTAHFVANSYRTGDAGLSIALAATRAGTLLALAGSMISDRRGRRIVLLASTIGVCASSLASGLAPNLLSFGVLQTVVRGFTNLGLAVGFITITEEAAEGARAWLLAVASIAGATGFALGALLLPLADLSGEAWRGLYLAAGLGLLLVPGIARRLRETRRFVSIAARGAHARATELVDRIYGRRFAVVAAIGFLLAFSAAPGSQLMNRYLQSEHGYSGLDVLLLRFVTQGAPALVAVWIGGRLAESSGRVPIAARATVVVALTQAVFFLSGGPLLWASLLVASIAGALGTPALSAFNTELFPTEVRGRAGGWLLVVTVAGSALGLALSGWLAGPMGSVGRAVAITSIGPLVVGLVLIRLLPEARGYKLDEISPPEV